MKELNRSLNEPTNEQQTRGLFWRKRLARLMLVLGLVSAGLFYSKQNPIKISYLAPSQMKLQSLRLSYESLDDSKNSRGMSMQIQPPRSRHTHEVQLAKGSYRLSLEATLLSTEGKTTRILETRKFDADGTDIQIRLQAVK